MLGLYVEIHHRNTEIHVKIEVRIEIKILIRCPYTKSESPDCQNGFRLNFNLDVDISAVDFDIWHGLRIDTGFRPKFQR